ncbi:2740_t:CDS:2 [Diversispora eburnea]|uniref:thioredoxin-dependent peroxiredoxin n=1 Tax=Diversispora eburnea TaxID=1213867 RepID=A0A9N8ZRV2_9GLOM|nr:2740_t:CDS:2 [Diversispora eburnea]
MSAVVRKPAPNFTARAVENGKFKDISLHDYKGKFVVFFFYPKDFTLVCPTEIIAFSDRVAEFTKRNTVVLGISCDSENTHRAWINVPRHEGGLGNLNIPLLSDRNHKISKEYGVLIEEEGFSLRGLFIIDDKGILRHITVNDLPIGRNVDEVLRLVDAIQFTDKHGEVCPVNWKAGAKTIKPNKPEEYFSEAYKK